MGKHIYMVGSTSTYYEGTSHGYQDAAIIKLRQDGVFQWAVYEGNVDVHEYYYYVATA